MGNKEEPHVNTSLLSWLICSFMWFKSCKNLCKQPNSLPLLHIVYNIYNNIFFRFYFEWESPSRWAGRRNNGWRDTQPVIWGGRTSNLFNIIREMTLRSERRWIPPRTANRNNGAVLIVTLQSGAQSAIRGGLIRGGERWMTLWKGHCTLYLEILIFPTPGLLREFEITWEPDRKSTTLVWLQTFRMVIFSQAH